jgi:hypothetical protein
MTTTDLPKNDSRSAVLSFMATHWRTITRVIWWAVVLSASIYLTVVRLSSITSDNPTSMDLGLLGLVAVLILLPFVSEISAFGFTVKKEIEEAKRELKQDIRDETQSIRSEITAIGIANSLTSNVYFQTGIPNPPPDSALADVRDQIAEILRQFREERGLREATRPHADVPPNTILAFQQRYLIEREVKRIWGTRVRNSDSGRYPPFARMVDDLIRYELITSNLGGSLREVFAVASSAIHGDEPSQEKIDFLREVAPGITATLSSIR